MGMTGGLEDCRVSTSNADESKRGKTVAEGKKSCFCKGLSSSGAATLISKNISAILGAT